MVLGGRWSGFFKLKEGIDGETGNKGLMGSCSNDDEGYCDSALKGDIDIIGMRNDAGEKSSVTWDITASIINGESWDDVREYFNNDYDSVVDCHI